MERVAFLIESSGESVSCLLNPGSLVARRRAGVRTLQAATGIVTGDSLSDEPVVGTGGGVTEYEVDLLFDVDVADEEAGAARGEAVRRETMDVLADPERIASEAADGATDGIARSAAAPRVARDVRDMTRPFWALAENAPAHTGYGAPPIVRMIWGRAWNVLGVVVAAAERLERFTENGIPRRSWLRLRLRRVPELRRPSAPAPEPVTPHFETPVLVGRHARGAEAVALNVAPDGMPADRLEQIAAQYLGDPSAWRWLATENDIDDPMNIPEGTVLRLPPATRSP